MSHIKPSNRRIIANGFAILAVALLMWLFTSKRNNDHPEDKANVTLKVAIDLSPNSLKIDTIGQLTGKQKQLLDLLIPKDSFEIIPYTDREKAIQDLKHGDIDLYATAIPASIATKMEGVNCTEWLTSSSYSLVFHRNNADWQEHFTGETPTNVVISKDDIIASTILENLSELSYHSIRLDERPLSPIELSIRLSKGEIDYLVCDTEIAQSIIKIDTMLQMADNIGFDIHQVWLINSENRELKTRLDSAIIALRGSREWQEIITGIN